MLRLLIRRRLTPISLSSPLSYSFSVASSPDDDSPFSPISKPQIPKTPQQKNTQKAPTFPLKSDMPFDFRYSFSESDPTLDPIGFREPPRFSPFGPGRLDWKWTGTCAPAEEWKKWEEMRIRVSGEELEEHEVEEMVEKYPNPIMGRSIVIRGK